MLLLLYGMLSHSAHKVKRDGTGGVEEVLDEWEVSQFSNQHLTPPHEAPPTDFIFYMSSLVFLIIMVSPFSTLAFWRKSLRYICWWRFFLHR